MPNETAAPAKASAQAGARPGRPDPIQLELVRNTLVAAAAEMGEALARAARGAGADETGDLAVGLFDAEGATIVQWPPAGADLAGVVRKGAAVFAAEGFQPGDAVVSNDSEASGQPVGAVTVFCPVFAGGALAGFAAARLRWIDVGGMTVGSAPVRARDVFSEGVQLPFLKARRSGSPDESVARLVRANTRFPGRALEDLEAQVLACRTGERRFLEAVGRHGADAVSACVRRIWDEAETVARRAVQAIPDGTYEAACRLDDDGVRPDAAIALAVKVIVAGDEMTVDFGGMPGQVDGPCNARSAEAVARAAFKRATAPHLPASEGAFRNLKVVCPEGTLVSARAGAPRGGSDLVAASAIDLVLRALGAALPERVAAGDPGNVGLASLSGAGARPGELFHSALPYVGGRGAGARADGASACLAQGGARFTPVEVQETAAPVRVASLALRPDSGGPGRHRGGLGVVLEREALADCSYHARYERTRDAPWGLAGGLPGGTTQTAIRCDGKDTEPPLKCEYFPLAKGDVEVVRTAGGGGFGPPWERDPEGVRRDVAEGYVTLEAARERYGVVLDAETLAIDAAQTAKLREKMRAASAREP